MKPVQTFLLAAIACCAIPALAQWQWIDAQGHKVFSDRAPPADIPVKNILRQPGKSTASMAPAPAPGEAGKAQPIATAKPAEAQDKALEEQKKKLQEAEAEKEKTKLAQIDKQRKENCELAQRTKATLSSGQLVSHVNAQGERGFMDDDTRSAALKRAEATIASDCGPATAAQ